MRAALVPVRHFLFSASAKAERPHLFQADGVTWSHVLPFPRAPQGRVPPPPPIPRHHMNTESPQGG